jgi:uncharacterized delta-60 repeat protein
MPMVEAGGRSSHASLMARAPRRRARWGGAGAVAAAVLLVTAGPAWAGAGDLDRDFGADGLALASSAGTYSGAQAVATDEDGRVVAVGFAQHAASVEADVMVVRFSADGALDRSFAGDGVALTDVDGESDEANAVALAPDDKIVVTGRSGRDLLVARYRSDGTPDETFAGGVVVIDSGGDEVGYGVAVGADGTVTVVGQVRTTDATTCCTNQALVVRLEADGQRDRTFGRGGVATFDLEPGAAERGGDRLSAVALERNGALVAAGGTGSDVALARLTPVGVLDRAFGTGGIVTTDLDGRSDDAAGLVELANGQLVVAGTSCDEPTGPAAAEADEDCDVALARYSRAGSLDRAFGRRGFVLADLGSTDGEQAVGVARQRDGHLVVAARTYGSGGLDLAAARFNANGQRDRSFGDDGVALADVAGATDETGGVALQPDGSIVVAGTAGLGSGGSAFVSALIEG